MNMKKSCSLFLLTASLCWIGPAAAADRSPQTAAQPEFSSRHRIVVAGPADVAVFRPGCRPGFKVAPTRFKAFDDRRWPYVSWRGSCDSLYVPGPLVTFVRNQWY
jgi:hypothetical protein